MSRSTPEKIPAMPKRKPRGSLWEITYFMLRSRIDPETGCWNWQRAIRWNGYGAVRFNRKTVGAHRLAYEVANSVTVDPKVDVCHSCDNRRCVNPAHLFLGSRKENMADCSQKGRIKTPMLRGEESPSSILTSDDVLTIREIKGVSQREIARRYGVDKGTIAGILHKKTWKHL